MVGAKHFRQAAAIAAGLALSPVAAAADSIPAGAWNCFQGPTWAQFGGGETAALKPGAAMAQMWIFDQHHYATDTQQDRGVYDLRGDEIVGASGPFQRVPVSAHYAAAGLGGKPTIFISWATAPSLALACQQTR